MMDGRSSALPTSSDILFGEVLSPVEKVDPVLGQLYDVLVKLSNGTFSVLHKVPVADPYFGGKYQTSQLKLPTSDFEKIRMSAAADATTGARVLVALVNGDHRNAVIMTGFPHPSRRVSLEDSQSVSSSGPLTIRVETDGTTTWKYAPPPIDVDTGVAGPLGVIPLGIAEKATNTALGLLSVDVTMSPSGKLEYKTYAKQTLTIDPTGNLLEYADVLGNGLKIDGISQEATLKSLLNATVSAGPPGVEAALKLEGGFVKLGNVAGDVLDVIDQTLDAFIKSAPSIGANAGGPVPLNPALLSLLVKTQIILKLIKGG